MKKTDIPQSTTYDATAVTEADTETTYFRVEIHLRGGGTIIAAMSSFETTRSTSSDRFTKLTWRASPASKASGLPALDAICVSDIAAITSTEMNGYIK